MNRDGHQGVVYFIGPEVEKTPAADKRTLFVVGKPPVDQIERMAREHKTPHIFMGANHSFTAASLDAYWDFVITTLLDKGFWVTLDYEAHDHGTVLKMLNRGIWQSRIFIPMLSVRIPHVQTSSTNLTIKIDDIDFKATNAGVWCLNHREITDSNRFTDWQDYVTDEVVAPLAGPANILPLKILVVQPLPNDELLEAKLPVFADINTPALSLEKVREIIESDVKNDQSLGLDPDAKSQLKAGDEEEGKIQAPVVTSPKEAAEAYAGGDAQPKTDTKKKSTKKDEGKA